MTGLWKKGAAAVGALAAAGAMLAASPAANAATTAKPQTAATPMVKVMAAKAKAAYSCPNHTVCIYQLRNAGGKKSVIKKSHSKLSWWNNRISSVVNRTSYPICVYNYAHYTGRFPGYPHTQFYLGSHSAANLKSAVDNRIGSYRFAPGKKASRC
jgi:hypothetical protein